MVSGAPANSPTGSADSDFCARYASLVGQVEDLQAELGSDPELTKIRAQLGDLQQNAQAIKEAIATLEASAQGRLEDALADLRSAVDDARAEVRQSIQESGAAEARDRAAQAVASIAAAWAGFQQAATIRCG